MKTALELKNRKSDIIAEMRKMLDLVEDEKRAMTTSEDKRYRELDAECDRLDREIMNAEANGDRRAKVDAADKDLHRVVNPLPDSARMGHYRAGGDYSTRADDGGFSSLSEYLWAIAAQRRDARPDDRLNALAEKREMQMSAGAGGGYAVPEVFSSLFLQAPAQAGIVRRYATTLPVGYPPDSIVHVPCLDQTSGTGGTYGGVSLTHGGEGITLTETNAKIREISLEPKQLNCYLPVTNKLLQNWETSNQVITRLLRDAVEGQIDYDCLRGDGINKSLGVINCAAAIAYTRAGANAIAFSDIYGMVSRCKMGGSPIWIGSQTIIPQLAAMTDAGSHAVWIGGGNLAQGASAPMPSTLFGFPLYFSDRLPALGTKGDLILTDLSYYLVKPGSGPRVDISTEFLFTQDKSVFRIIMMMDGRPWLSEPIGLEGDSTKTISPFVVLQ